MPYIAINGSAAHEPVAPRRQAWQAPQLIWNGTTTRSPTVTSRTPSPMATTSAMPSCPNGLLRAGDFRFGGLAPGVYPGLFEHQMLHRTAFLEPPFQHS
jgi:hypothetical protein